MRKMTQTLYIFPTIIFDDVVDIVGTLDVRASAQLFIIAMMDEVQVEQVEAVFPNTITRMK